MPESIVTLSEELLRSRVLHEACMFVGDKTPRIVGSIAEVFPDTPYYRRAVHFYRNMPAGSRSRGDRGCRRARRHESQGGSRGGSGWTAPKPQPLRGSCVSTGFTYTSTMPASVSTGGVCRRTHLVGTFPDGNSALMIVTTRLKRGAPIPGRNAAGRVTAPEGEPGAVRKRASFFTAPAGEGATT